MSTDRFRPNLAPKKSCSFHAPERPTARIIGALAFVVGGALWAFTRHEEGARRFAQAIVGVAIMIGAANIVSALAFVGATV